MANACLAVAISTALFLPVATRADVITMGSGDHRITVAVHFPSGETKRTTVSYRELGAIAYKKVKLPKGISLAGYKIDKWVYRAFTKMKLDFAGKTESKRDEHGAPVFRETTITRIGYTESGALGKWVVHVNGVKSKYAIDQQGDADDIKKIEFFFVREKGAPPPTPLVPIPAGSSPGGSAGP